MIFICTFYIGENRYYNEKNGTHIATVIHHSTSDQRNSSKFGIFIPVILLGLCMHVDINPHFQRNIIPLLFIGTLQGNSS